MAFRENRRLGAALAFRKDCAWYGVLEQRDGELILSDADRIEVPSGLTDGERLFDGRGLGLFLRKKLKFRWGSIPLR